MCHQSVQITESFEKFLVCYRRIQAGCLAHDLQPEVIVGVPRAGNTIVGSELAWLHYTVIVGVEDVERHHYIVEVAQHLVEIIAQHAVGGRRVVAHALFAKGARRREDGELKRARCTRPLVLECLRLHESVEHQRAIVVQLDGILTVGFWV